VLEKKYVPEPFETVYENPQSQPDLIYLGGFDEVRVFAIQSGD
jgi:hypothetical protein